MPTERPTRDLIHPRVRAAFAELSSSWGVLRTISGAFEVEGFVRGPEVQSGGQRRSLFDTFANAIDWSDPEQVGRALRVFDEILTWGSEEYSGEAIKNMNRLLSYDGYMIDDQRLIRPTSNRTLELPLEQLRDPAAIEDHLRRLDAAGDTDPALAISSAKSLLEATCKLVLEQIGLPYDDRSDVPQLVRDVQKALKVHPDDIAPTAKGRATIVRTLSNLSQVATGLAELRNEYGSDHGRARSVSGIRPRHAHLAVGSAQTFCRFLLETLRDRPPAIGGS